MNTYNVNDESFQKTSIYENFMRENLGIGSLKIRAYAASEAIPIAGLKIIVMTNFEDNNIIFYEGVTDNSGIIEKIKLPTYKLQENDLVAPLKRVYKIIATINENRKEYDVNIYDGICVVQNISMVSSNMEGIGEY